MSHFIKKCVHGVVVAQCRCMGPKDVIVVPCPDRCTEKDRPEPPPTEMKT